MISTNLHVFPSSLFAKIENIKELLVLCSVIPTRTSELLVVSIRTLTRTSELLVVSSRTLTRAYELLDVISCTLPIPSELRVFVNSNSGMNFAQR